MTNKSLSELYCDRANVGKNRPSSYMMKGSWSASMDLQSNMYVRISKWVRATKWVSLTYIVLICSSIATNVEPSISIFLPLRLLLSLSLSSRTMPHGFMHKQSGNRQDQRISIDSVGRIIGSHNNASVFLLWIKPYWVRNVIGFLNPIHVQRRCPRCTHK